MSPKLPFSERGAVCSAENGWIEPGPTMRAPAATIRPLCWNVTHTESLPVAMLGWSTEPLYDVSVRNVRPWSVLTVTNTVPKKVEPKVPRSTNAAKRLPKSSYATLGSQHGRVNDPKGESGSTLSSSS